MTNWSKIPGDSEGRLRYNKIGFFSKRKWYAPISEKEYGNPGKRFVSFCAGRHKEDRDPEFAERLNEGFKLIGEAHHEKCIGKHCFRVCPSWDNWDY